MAKKDKKSSKSDASTKSTKAARAKVAVKADRSAKATKHPESKPAEATPLAPVTFTEAALGAQVQVPTLDGPVTLKVPAGTPGGKTFRVKGKGAPRKGGHGDLLVTVDVDVPKKLTKEQKRLLTELQATQEASPRGSLGVA